MKTKANIFVMPILISLTIILSACSDNTAINEEKTEVNSVAKNTTLQSNIDSGNKDVIENSDIVISLNDIKFNLSAPFAEEELNKLDLKDLAIIRNSIYAKYGYEFTLKEYKDYFVQFSWYKPSTKKVDEILNALDNENIKKIICVEERKKLTLKNSADNINYLNNGKVDISIKSEHIDEVLYIIKEDLITTEQSNFPTKITLRIKSSQVVFESKWNDGLFISISDFDDTDKDVDIFITEFGTHIGCKTFFYKFDGSAIYEYDKLSHFGREFLYDGKGNIYHWLNDGRKKEFNKSYNYKTKLTNTIEDEKLITELNKFVK